MRATVALDDELVHKAQELSGVTERTALLRMALKSLIHFEASRRLAAVGGTEPELEEIKRVRAGNLGRRRQAEDLLGRKDKQ
jgi:Arc/MetJ family transcription regulator